MKTAPLKSNLAQPDPPKTEPQKTDPWIGSVLWGRIGGAVLVLALLVACAVAVSFCGCAPNQTATAQIMSETSDPHAIARAVYLDARTWYNEAQQSFIDGRASLAIDQRRRFNALLDDAGRALDLWGATLALGRNDTFDREAFRKAKKQLIDAGFVLLTKD